MVGRLHRDAQALAFGRNGHEFRSARHPHRWRRPVRALSRDAAQERPSRSSGSSRGTESAGRRLRVRGRLQRRDTGQLPRPLTARASMSFLRTFRHWGDIKVHHPGRKELRLRGPRVRGGESPSAARDPHRSGRRTSDVELEFSTEVTDFSDLPPADLIVGADGANSLVRRQPRRRSRAHGRSQTQSLHLVRDTQGLRRVQLHLRGHSGRDGLGPRLSLQRRGEHLHRGDGPRDLAGVGVRRNVGASRSPRAPVINWPWTDARRCSSSTSTVRA